jgi:hypothetical protein
MRANAQRRGDEGAAGGLIAHGKWANQLITACLSHVEWKPQSLKIAHADLSISLRQVREEVRALRDHLRARDIKDEMPQVREQESVPSPRQRFRGDIQEELKLEAETTHWGG